MTHLELTSFLTSKIKKLRIVVIGDMMLDQYFYGDVKRISPEAPVPITKINKTKSVLGGAANVAANLANLDCQVFVGGIIGEDKHRELLCQLLDNLHIDYSGLLISGKRKTITKLRVLGGQQQMLRMDFEETGTLDKEETERLSLWLEKLLKDGIDGIIISDYAKGVCSLDFCQWIINVAKKYKVTVLIDPKGSDWRKYFGCDYITPNLKELCEALGLQKENSDDAVIEMAKSVREKFKIQNVIVTRSEKGISLINENEIFHDTAKAIDVFDVSGAGDTVAATILSAVAAKISIKDAIYLANLAASCVVSKVGTYPIHRYELLEKVLGNRQVKSSYQNSNWSEAMEIIQAWRISGEKIVFTNGCFDILHVGHISYLEKAKCLGNRLVVGINSDKSVSRLKGDDRPINSEYDRARILNALACVDLVIVFDQDTPLDLIKSIKPDTLVKGGDYTLEKIIGKEFANEVKIIDFEEGYSTTNIITKIKKTI